MRRHHTMPCLFLKPFGGLSQAQHSESVKASMSCSSFLSHTLSLLFTPQHVFWNIPRALYFMSLECDFLFAYRSCCLWFLNQLMSTSSSWAVSSVTSWEQYFPKWLIWMAVLSGECSLKICVSTFVCAITAHQPISTQGKNRIHSVLICSWRAYNWLVINICQSNSNIILVVNFSIYFFPLENEAFKGAKFIIGNIYHINS